MATVSAAAAAIPSQRSRKTPALPWFTGDVPAIVARLRAAALERPDGDAVQAVIYIEGIQEHPRLSAPAKARLTAAVLQAVQLVRGWDAPMAEPPADWQPPCGEWPDAPQQDQVVAPGSCPAPADEDAVAAAAVTRGDVAEIAVGLLEHARARPEGDCVRALVLLSAIHAEDLPAAELNRRTVAVLAAVRQVRGWSS